jgi:hypothetical protein
VREELTAILDPRFAHGSLRSHEEISLLKKVEWITPDIRAGMRRELNRQEAEYDQTVRPVHDAADAAFEKRWDAMQAAFATPLTTVAGFRALIDFAMSESFVTDGLIETETTEPWAAFSIRSTSPRACWRCSHAQEPRSGRLRRKPATRDGLAYRSMVAVRRIFFCSSSTP